MKSFFKGFEKQAGLLPSIKPTQLLMPKVPTPRIPGTPAGKMLGGKHGVSTMRI
jgi:hypothetical protein